MIYKSIRFAIVILLLLLYTRPSWSQSGSLNGYHVEHFTDENGLPQNSINDLLFDNQGYLWLASQVGLIRFDGKSFKLFAPEDRPAMESNFVRLGLDAGGTIFCQTDDQFIYGQPNDSHQSLRLISTPARARPLLLHAKTVIDLDSFLKQPHPGGLEYKRQLFNELQVNPDQIYPIDHSRLYLVSGRRLYKYDGKELSLAHPPPERKTDAERYLMLGKRLYGISGDSVLGNYDDGSSILPHRIHGDLPRLLDPKSLKTADFRYFLGVRTHILVKNQLFELFSDQNGQLDTRYVLDLDFIHNISSVDCDPALDMLIVTSQTEGFYMLRRSLIRGPNLPAGLRSEMDRYLFGPMVLHGKEILTDRFVFDGSGTYRLLPDQDPPWQHCLYLDKTDHIWGAFDSIPRQMDDQLQLIRAYQPLDGAIIDFKEDERGDLYCLTGRSLWKMDKEGFIRLYTSPPGRAYESFCLVAPGRFWIATTDGMIQYEISQKTGSVVGEMAGSHVRSIHPCRDGSVLLGTYGQGYDYYRGGHFFKMPLDKNNWLITAHGFLEDSQGFVWIPCNKGLFKAKKKDLDDWCDSAGGMIYYYYYGRKDGLSTNEFNGGFNQSMLITPDDLVTLLSMQGMVCFDADSMRSDLPTGPIGITHIEIDGKPAEAGDLISLPAGYDNSLAEVSCPYFGNQANLYMEYSIKGLNDEWKELDPDGIINLSRLGPGNYTLMVRKTDGFGKNHFTVRQWEIVVSPHFYQTLWFKVFAALTILLLVTLLVHSRFNLRQKRIEVMAKAEKLRATVESQQKTMQELRDSQQALRQTSKMREKLISLVIHDLRSPIRFISMVAGDLHDNLNRLDANELRERAFWIKKGAGELVTFSEDLLLWVTSQKNNFSVVRREFPLRPLLQEMMEFFREQSIQKGNRLELDAPPDLTVYADTHILITILRNLVDNANKYTTKGHIRIHARAADAKTVLSVSDTGKGMSSKQVAAYLNIDNLDGIRSGSQLGHTFIVDLTQKMNGAVSLQSTEGTGTTVILTFDRHAGIS